MTTSIIRHLKEHGPEPIDELPHYPGINDRANGATTFDFNTRTRGDQQMFPRRATAIVYLFDEHSREEVARAWCEENNVPMDGVTDLTGMLTAISTSAGKKWSPAFRTVLKERGSVGRNAEENDGGDE